MADILIEDLVPDRIQVIENVTGLKWEKWVSCSEFCDIIFISLK